MPELSCINLSTTNVETSPYLHFCAVDVFYGEFEKQLYDWLANEVEWEFTKTDFYTQYEFSLLHMELSVSLQSLKSEKTIETIKQKLSEVFGKPLVDLVDITVHKLIDGHRIGVHNDFIEGEETHRLIIQINRDWQEANGGYLMLFGSPSAADVKKVIQPLTNSAFGFEISPSSYHAVSTVHDFSRYTLVYTFRERVGVPGSWPVKGRVISNFKTPTNRDEKVTIHREPDCVCH